MSRSATLGPVIPKFSGPTEVKAFSRILPMQLYELPALTAVDTRSWPLAAGSLPSPCLSPVPPARPWCPLQPTNPAASAETQLTVLKPGLGRDRRHGEVPEPSLPTAAGRAGCRLEGEKRGLLRTWPSCRGTCSAGAGSSKWCGLVPRPGPPRT